MHLEKIKNTSYCKGKTCPHKEVKIGDVKNRKKRIYNERGKEDFVKRYK